MARTPRGTIPSDLAKRLPDAERTRLAMNNANRRDGSPPLKRSPPKLAAPATTTTAASPKPGFKPPGPPGLGTVKRAPAIGALGRGVNAATLALTPSELDQKRTASISSRNNSTAAPTARKGWENPLVRGAERTASPPPKPAAARSGDRSGRVTPNSSLAANKTSPTGTTNTKGGSYPTYKRGSSESNDFNSAFASARKAGKATFEWNGRSYTTKRK